MKIAILPRYMKHETVVLHFCISIVDKVDIAAASELFVLYLLVEYSNKQGSTMIMYSGFISSPNLNKTIAK